jgi:hypothetical protein
MLNRILLQSCRPFFGVGVEFSPHDFLRLNHFAAAQARSAYTHVLRGCADLGVNWAQVDVPTPLAHVVGMTDGTSELRAFAANVANSCHNLFILPKFIAEVLFYKRLSFYDCESFVFLKPVGGYPPTSRYIGIKTLPGKSSRGLTKQIA